MAELQHEPGGYIPAEHITIDSLETIKALSDPLRLQIIEDMMAGPVTVKQLAASLGVSPTKLYYHINMLEEHGLIKVVSTRVVSGIIEKQYWVAAFNFEIDRALLSRSESGISDHVSAFLRAMLDGIQSDFNRSVKAGLIDVKSRPELSGGNLDVAALNNTGNDKHDFFVGRTLSRMSLDRADEFQRRMAELVREFSDAESSEDGDRPYGVFVIMYPVAHQERGSQGEGDGEPGAAPG